MSTICDDYGYWRDFIPQKPDPVISSTSEFASRFIYEAERACTTATEACARITYCADRANAFGATDEQLEGLKNAARDVECAIAQVIETLAKRAAAREAVALPAADFSHDARGEAA